MAAPARMLTAADLRGGSARRRREATIRRLFGVAAGISVVISAVIVVALIGRAIDFLRQIDPILARRRRVVPPSEPVLDPHVWRQVR